MHLTRQTCISGGFSVLKHISFKCLALIPQNEKIDHHMNTLLLVLASFILPSLAEVSLGFPFNRQFPDVARVGQTYSFVISNETYISSNGQVSYSASNLPSWLSFDGDSRALSGTPGSDDVSDSVMLTLSGADGDGSSSNNYTIVVSDQEGPELSNEPSIFQELARNGETNGINGIVLSPGESFSLQFSRDIFQVPSGSDNSITAYYARSENRTSLPNWVHFDSETLEFSGTAPYVNSDIAPSIEYGFLLMATDYENYAAAYGTFRIVLGYHQLSTSLTNDIVLNGTAGQHINHTISLDEFTLDGETPSVTNLTFSLENSASWVSLENNVVYASIPQDASDETESFNVTVSDYFGDSVMLNLQVQVISSPFTVDEIPDMNATRGSFFTQALRRSYFTDLKDTTVEASFSADWLTFHSDNLSFTGQVPSRFGSVDVELTARKDDLSDTISFYINGRSAIISSSSRSSSTRSSSTSSASSSASATRTSSSATVTSSSSVSPSAAANVSRSSNKNLAIGLGVALPLAFLIALAAILLFFWRRRRQAPDDEKPDAGSSVPISAPIIPFGGAAMSDIESMDSAKRLSALNILKLDQPDSQVSSTTNVASQTSSVYDDAFSSRELLLTNHDENPKESWRNNGARNSAQSLATVATNDLFSVRVVDDDRKRKSQMSFLANLQGSDVSTTSNIQRLDSMGNVVTPPSPNRNLDVLPEEPAPQFRPKTLSDGNLRWESVEDEFEFDPRPSRDDAGPKLVDFTRAGRTSSYYGNPESLSSDRGEVTDDSV